MITLMENYSRELEEEAVKEEVSDKGYHSRTSRSYQQFS
jgi:hypothetical protein